MCMPGPYVDFSTWDITRSPTSWKIEISPEGWDLSHQGKRAWKSCLTSGNLNFLWDNPLEM